MSKYSNEKRIPLKTQSARPDEYKKSSRIVTKKRTVPQRSCNINKKRNMSIPILPNEIIFNILVWLPADILYNTMRYVCNQWYDIIKDPHFAREQLLVCSTIGGLCFQCSRDGTVYFAQFGKKKGTLSQLVTFPSASLVRSTCNGLILFRNDKLEPMRVINPLTKQLLTLPLPDSVSNKNLLKRCKMLTLYSHYYSIGFTRYPLEYKVVFSDHSEESVCYGVFTLGKDDEWRITNSDSLFLRDNSRLFGTKALSAGNFLHWVCSGADYIITMDMESEQIYFSPAPKSGKFGMPVSVHYLVSGGSLTCMLSSDKTLSWEVWVCLDIIGCKWKTFDIDLRPKKRWLWCLVRSSVLEPRNWFYTKLRPVAWIENGEVVLFRPLYHPMPFIVYNVKTRYAYQLHDHDHACFGFINSYSPSLVSLY